MKCPFVVAGLLFLSTMPSFAQDMTSLQYMLSKGVVIHGDLHGNPIDMRVTYKDDGTSVTKMTGQGGRRWNWPANGVATATNSAPAMR